MVGLLRRQNTLLLADRDVLKKPVDVPQKVRYVAHEYSISLNYHGFLSGPKPKGETGAKKA